jgi:hypothetical protein
MASLKQLARCIGLSGDISIIRDFYGYTRVPTGTQLSLITQARLLKGRHIHLNLIRVGTGSNGWFSDADEQEIDAAVQFTRNTYATVNIGVGRVERYSIATADANGRQDIDSDDEAETLTNEWTVPNDALDVFFVLTYAGDTIGLSRVDGSCDKDAKGMDGSVVAIEGMGNTTGFVLAHEVGHYLGLEHIEDDSTNLLFPTVPNGGRLTVDQGNNMGDHCWIRSACQA